MKRSLALTTLTLAAALATAALASAQETPAAPAAPQHDAPANHPPLTIEQAEAQLAKGIQLLDVRTQEEWDEGTLKGAKRADVNAEDFLATATAQLDPAKPLLVYCRSGKRSQTAATKLRAAGFTEVYEIRGGILAWIEADKPVEK